MFEVGEKVVCIAEKWVFKGRAFTIPAPGPKQNDVCTISSIHQHKGLTYFGLEGWACGVFLSDSFRKLHDDTVDMILAQLTPPKPVVAI